MKLPQKAYTRDIITERPQARSSQEGYNHRAITERQQ